MVSSATAATRALLPGENLPPRRTTTAGTEPGGIGIATDPQPPEDESKRNRRQVSLNPWGLARSQGVGKRARSSLPKDKSKALPPDESSPKPKGPKGGAGSQTNKNKKRSPCGITEIA